MSSAAMWKRGVPDTAHDDGIGNSYNQGFRLLA